MSTEIQIDKPANPVDRKNLKSGDVENLCRLHFAPPHFAFLPQVRNGTGFTRKTARTADAVAMGTWPSRGLHLHGIEIKVSLQDFKREIENPAKAEDIARFCHYWWLAVSHEKVAPLEMIPANWGLLVVTEDGTAMKVVKQAVALSPIAPDHSLLASVMRNMAAEYVPISSLNEWKSQARRELEQTADRNSKFLRETSERALKDAYEAIGKVEAAFGCRIQDYHADRFVDDFKLARRLRQSGWQILRSLENLLTIAEKFRPEVEAIKSAVEKHEADEKTATL
jgi:hypothetical protein